MTALLCTLRWDSQALRATRRARILAAVLPMAALAYRAPICSAREASLFLAREELTNRHVTVSGGKGCHYKLSFPDI